MGYYFVIQKEMKKFFFKLIPNNNGFQEIGSSVGYENYYDCQKALEYFKEYVNNKKINQKNLCNTKVENLNGKYVFKYFDEEENLIFQRIRPYGNESECKKGIDRVYAHIDSEIKSKGESIKWKY